MRPLNQRLAEGDRAAFADWYDTIAGSVYHYLLTQTGTSHDASDLLQNTFMRLYCHRNKLRQVDNLRAYTFRTARNEWMRWRDHRRHEVQGVPLEPWFDGVATGTGDDAIDAEELQRALRELEPDYREVIELKIFGSLTLQEIAEVRQKPLGTIASWYRRGIERMQMKLRRRQRGI